MSDLKKLAIEIRRDVIEMIYRAGSGHPGGSLSSVEFFVSFYFNSIKKEDDYFILSNGHVCPAWYAVLAHKGAIKHEELLTLREFGSLLQGHPEKGTLKEVITTTGSLGQGIAVAAGLALGLKRKKQEEKVFCLTSDGEQDEGSVWELARIAAHYKLDNLYIAIDRDQMQIGGFTEDISRLEPLKEKYIAFGFDAWEIDGNDVDEIKNTFMESFQKKGKPKVIILKTIRGKGVSFMENSPHYHAKTLTEDLYRRAMEELNGI